MERMEHFRNAKLYSGDQVVMENVEGHLGFHSKSNGRKQWFGYFELHSNQHLEAGAHYKLELADGRVAELNASDVRNSEQRGTDIHVAEFYVIGEIHRHRRNLRDDGTRRHLLG
jgi:hypothetical protein